VSNFCTDCGARFVGTPNFCNECGKPRFGLKPPSDSVVHVCTATHDPFDLAGIGIRFFREDTPEPTPHSRTGVACIVYTCFTRLRHFLGEAVFGELEQRVCSLVGLRRGSTSYFLLDPEATFLGEPLQGDWREHVLLLRKAVDLLRSRAGFAVTSVFIIGDGDVVPMPCIENPVGPDDDVETDYPYASLSVEDPWESMEPAVVAVGRLPVGKSSGAESAARYLDHLSRAQPAAEFSRSCFGIGAQKWEGASRSTFALFSPTSLQVSPPVTAQSLDCQIQADHDLLYFNLHGSDDPDEPGWFGESMEKHFPLAVQPGHLGSTGRANVVGVEACYGAKFAGLSASASCLLQALGGKTLGFVGSSRIAFGPPEPPIGLADVVIGHFLKNVAEGESLGQAHAIGRNELWDAVGVSPHARLTVLEFNLFGDPTYVANPQTGKSGVRKETLAAPEAGSRAGGLIQAIRAQSGLARGKISKAVRRLRVDELISLEVRRGIDKCRQAAQSIRIPLPLGSARPEPTEIVLEVGGEKNLILNYIVRQGAVISGCSVVQDLSTTQVKGIYVYR
jgi:hypothetical protein